MRKVYVSPAFFINSIIMGILLAMSLVFIFVFDSIYSVEYIVVGALLGSWSIFFFVTILIAFSKRKGFTKSIVVCVWKILIILLFPNHAIMDLIQTQYI